MAPAVVRLRRTVRTSEAALILVALMIGIAAGIGTLLQSGIAHGLQVWIYNIDSDARLSAQDHVAPLRLLALPIGGAVLAGFGLMLRRRKRPPIDVVEANALNGGVIPIRDSLQVSAQTLLSNGAGASVGLEAAYAQIGGGIASVAGQWLRLRRADLRILVGAGAGAAVGAAFGAPLTGAFYAFEIVIGAYTPAAIAPVLTASLAASVIVRSSGAHAYLIALPSASAILTWDYLLYASLGLFCALLGIALMRLVTLLEIGVRRSPIPDIYRPIAGGLLLIPLAWASPQTLSAGHGALHLDLTTQIGLVLLIQIFLLKALASAVSLGFGFRGGLFFASLFLGSLVGQIFSGVIALIPGANPVDPSDAAVIGMAAMAVSVVGGPMTMSMLVLETTHDFALTGTAIAATLCASTLVRETFGYSFSTWRLHTRGETVRSARDIGWIKNLTAGNLMQGNAPTIAATATIAEFRRRFPLGAARKVILTGTEGGYAGLAATIAAYGEDVQPEAPLSSIAVLTDRALAPEHDAVTIMRIFEEEEADDLAVVAPDRTILGLVSETFVRKRYTEEIEKSQRALFGE
ncbi:chloride channel protein [Sphingomonas vulcanisoli]|nr:chloride channel protein [Sphingomonas vulcanisoli]